MKSKKKKGQAMGLGDVPNIVLILIIIGIVLAFGAMFMVEMRDQADAMFLTNSTEGGGAITMGIINDSLEGLETLGEWQPTIAVAVIIAVALAIVIGLFAFRRQGGL